MATEYTPRQEFTHLVFAALERHRGYNPIPNGVKCNGCDWTSFSGNRRKAFSKHQAWAVAEEFGWDNEE